jgi:hypothetical protein
LTAIMESLRNRGRESAMRRPLLELATSGQGGAAAPRASDIGSRRCRRS